MRKGIKILRIVGTILLFLVVVLPLTLSLLLHIPIIQNAVVRGAAAFASDFLETEVRFERINVGFLGRVELDGFYVEDYQRDTLLYVGHLNGYLNGVGLFGEGLIINRAQMTDAKLYLRETPEGVMNIKQVVDRMANPNRKKKKNPFRMILRQASVANMALRIERLQHRNPEYGVDYGNMYFTDLQGAVDNFQLEGAEIHTKIDRFSGREQSGFTLNHLSGQFHLNRGVVEFKDVVLATPHSYLSLPLMTLHGEDWAFYKDFVRNVQMKGRLEHSSLSSDDVAYFAPNLRDWHLTLTRAEAEFEGVVSNFEARIHNLYINDQTNLSVRGKIRGLPDVKQTHFDLSLPRLSTRIKAVDQISRSITKKALPENLVTMLSKSGELRLRGDFHGLISSFQASAVAQTSVGKIKAKMKMRPVDGGLKHIEGDLSTEHLRLGDLLNQQALLGMATFSTTFDGEIGTDFTDIDLQADVSHLDFKQYAYQALRFDGRLNNREFNGLITARDPNLNLDFKGMIDYNEQLPRYDFRMKLNHANLRAMNINRRDSLSQFSGLLFARGFGRTLDDMNGEVLLTDATYHYNEKKVEADTVFIRGKNSDQSKFLELRSDFLNASFTSKISYHDVFEYLRRSAWKYLPRLSKGEKVEVGEYQIDKMIPDGVSLLNIDVLNFNPVANALAEGLQVADGSKLELQFNPARNRLSFMARSEYIERGQLLATRMDLKASNQGDSLSVYGVAEDLFAGGLHLPHFSMRGGAREGVVQVSAAFNNMERKISGTVGVRAGIDKKLGKHGKVLNIKILPSQLTVENNTWKILANRIELDTAQMRVNSFYVVNTDARQSQDLMINGVVSHNPQDSLILNLRNFELSTLSYLTDRMGYTVKGLTSGQAVMKTLLGGGGETTADIWIDDLSVNDIATPPLRLISQWDFAQNRAGITISDRKRNKTLIWGSYRPDSVRYEAHIRLDSVEMALLDPILSGVISSTKGVSDVALDLEGEQRKANLSGRIHVHDLSTKIDFTQVTYSMKQTDVEVKNNRFTSLGVPVFDSEGNRGLLDFKLDLEHLSNINYQIKVKPEKMLVLNTGEHDNDAFYGKIYASGSALIQGEKGNVDMNISASSEGNSSFFMPLMSKSNVSSASFVRFKTPEVVVVDEAEAKKKAFEDRRKKKERAVNRMNINMSLDIKPNVDLELTLMGNTLRGAGQGKLNLQINPSMNLFEMYGNYEISQGSFLFSLQNILNRKFEVTPGSSISWTGSPLEAKLDIEAIYKLKASLQPLLGGSADRHSAERAIPVDCIIRLGDLLTNPAINFDVRVPATDPETQALVQTAINTPESMNMQFLYLLLFKSFMAESTNSTQKFGSNVSYNKGLELLSNQLSNWLSSSGYNILIRYRPKSEMTNDEVDFGLSKSLINNRLYVEVEGNYMLDNKNSVNNSMSNFMGEAYITYLIDRAGALKLKAFTQTIDRFDENQGLQETGVGIYFKEDFNNFSDFRRRFKERFTNKKRQARRQARRAARRQEKLRADSLKQVPDEKRILEDSLQTVNEEKQQ